MFLGCVDNLCWSEKYIFNFQTRISNILSTTKRTQQFVKCANPTFKIKAGEKKVRKSKTVGKKHTPLSKLGDKVSGRGRGSLSGCLQWP